MGLRKSAHISLTKRNRILIVMLVYTIDASMRTADFALMANINQLSLE